MILQKSIPFNTGFSENYAEIQKFLWYNFCEVPISRIGKFVGRNPEHVGVGLVQDTPSPDLAVRVHYHLAKAPLKSPRTGGVKEMRWDEAGKTNKQLTHKRAEGRMDVKLMKSRRNPQAHLGGCWRESELGRRCGMLKTGERVNRR